MLEMLKQNLRLKSKASIVSTKTCISSTALLLKLEREEKRADGPSWTNITEHPISGYGTDYYVKNWLESMGWNSVLFLLGSDLGNKGLT